MKYILLLFLSLPAYAGTISGTVTGLATGKSVILVSNKISKIITTNGPYTMTDGGGPLSIGIQPAGQVCTLVVTDVNCLTSYTVGGTVTGLTSTGYLILRLNNSSSLLVSQNATTYKFASSLVAGSSYAIAVGIQPLGLKCTVSNSMGVVQANVTDANITCVALRSTIVYWTQPTQNTDGTPLTDLTGFILQYGTDPLLKTYASKFVTMPNLSTTVNNLVVGNTYYFSVASVSASGGTGPRSNFATMVVQ